MRRIQLVTLLFSGLFILLPTARADDSDVAASVRAALGEMHSWVGTDRKGTGWRKFLRSKDLEIQLEKGDQADKNAVAEILKKYSSNTPGLDHWRFAAVREALTNWQSHLESLQVAVGEPPAPDEPAEPAPAVPLPEAASDAKDAFQAVSEKTVKQAKSDLQSAMQNLHNYLAGGGTRKLNGWKKHLQWETVEKSLSEDKPDIRVLNRVLAQYRGYNTGLERSEFTNVRDALLKYRNAVYFSSAQRIEVQFTKNVDVLAKKLASYEAAPNLADASLIGRTLGWLESGGQAQSLIENVRARYRHPNLFARISSRLITTAMETDVDEHTGVYDSVSGMSVSGSAHTKAKVTAALVPNEKRGVVEIRMLGNANSNTVGSLGPIKVYATGATSIDGRKRVMIDADGWDSEPAIAYCATGTNVYGLDAPLPIIRKIAWQQVAKNKASGEIQAARKAANKVAWRIENQTAGVLAKANESFNERFKHPLIRLGASPKQLRFRTTSDHLYVKMLQSSAFQIAAPSEPPPVPDGQDLVVRMHESLISNMSEAVLGGETVSNDQLRKTIKELTGKVPDSLKAGPGSEPFSITFSTIQPITLEFADQSVKITIRGRRFTRGNQAYSDAMYITATYKVERAGAGAKLTRQGNVVADYQKKGKQSSRQIAFKNFLSQSFEKLFKEEFISKGLKLPERFKIEGLLSLKHLHCDGGWLGLGWRAPPKDVRTADVKAKE